MAPTQLIQLSAINLRSTFPALRRRPRAVLLADCSLANVGGIATNLEVVTPQVVFLALVKLRCDPGGLSFVIIRLPSIRLIMVVQSGCTLGTPVTLFKVAGLDVTDEIFVGFLKATISILVVVFKVMSCNESGSRVLAQLDGGLCRRNVVFIQLDPTRGASVCVLDEIGRRVLINWLDGCSQREM